MEHYAAIDVSLEWSSICIVDPSGRIVREAKVRSEREAVVDFFQASGLTFAHISDKAIRRGSFHSVRDLVAKIDHFVAYYNQTCRPFVWTATADSILAKLQRLCSRINGTEH